MSTDVNGRFGAFLSTHGEWLRWLIAIGAIAMLYLSDARYARREEVTAAIEKNTIQQQAAAEKSEVQAEALNQRVTGMEKTLAIMATQTTTLTDHEERIRALERTRK